MAHFNVTYKARNVNTKRLLERVVQTVQNTVEEFVYVRTTQFSQPYDFSGVSDYIDMFMEQLVEEHVITTYDVIGDTRNNDLHSMTRGTLVLDLEFQQFNCLNTTSITFEIRKV